MKVAGIYGTDALLGGGEVSFTLTLQSVQAAGWDVLAIIPGNGPLQAILAGKGIPVKVLPLDSLRRPAHLLKLLSPSAEWIEAIKEYKPDLIHCNAVRPALYGQAVGHKCRVPTIFHARIDHRDPADVFLVRRMNGIICSSRIVRKRFPEGRKGPVVKVIHNPIDLEEFRTPRNTAQLRNLWQQGPNDWLIGLPSRISPAKGQLQLLDAAPTILKHFPNTMFVFIGEEDKAAADFERALRKVIETRGLANRVIFAGFQSDMASAYSALDVVVFPSHSEGFGRIVIEAGASRRPLVANDLAVLREILPDNGADYLVDCTNAESLAGAVMRLLSDAALRSESANRLFDHVRNVFNLGTHRKLILSAYDDVLKSVR